MMHALSPLFRLSGRRIAMFWTFEHGVRQGYGAPSSMNKSGEPDALSLTAKTMVSRTQPPLEGSP